MVIPFIGRLSATDYAIVFLVYFEAFLSFVLKLIPKPLIQLFNSIISYSVSADDSTFEEKLRNAPTIHEMCQLFNITVEDHLVRTEDNYILTLHRIPPNPNNPNNNGKVVYLHHGLLMCSDIWCCNVQRNRNLPFVLHDLGYDVWMGNNRGNKYSTTHLYYTPKSDKFWDFGIDEFAFFDIPNSIEFISEFCHVGKIICVGFSQGSAQMFAAFSFNESLNSKVSHLIAIAPAMTPKGLHHRLFDSIAKSSPALMYLFFGRKAILPSAVLWQRRTHPRIFTNIIDVCNRILFDWKAYNIESQQKLISYAKLYSTTSVKCIVHWFQILRSQKFNMFEGSDELLNSLTKPYQVCTFPTRTNIKIPILLIYGGADSLVDIKVMKRNLPPTAVFAVKVDKYEHLDLIWGKNVDKLVVSRVVKFVEFYNGDTNGFVGPRASGMDTRASTYGASDIYRVLTLGPSSSAPAAATSTGVSKSVGSSPVVRANSVASNSGTNRGSVYTGGSSANDAIRGRRAFSIDDSATGMPNKRNLMVSEEFSDAYTDNTPVAGIVITEESESGGPEELVADGSDDAARRFPSREAYEAHKLQEQELNRYLQKED